MPESNTREAAAPLAPAHRSTPGWVALLIPILMGLAVSMLLLVDYIRPAPVFCAYDGGCDTVKKTAYAAVMGVPTPAFGIGMFALFGALALLRGPTARVVLFAVSGVAAAVAVFLISVQVRMNVFCIYCMTVDTATLLVLGASIWRFRAGWDPPASLAARAGAGLLCAASLAVPALVGFTRHPEVPEPVAREIKATPPGKVTVVDFVDFECPFCRESHAEIAPILESQRDRIRIVRKNVPLTRIHPHAMDAARAACCGEIMGKGDAFADALFSLPADDLTPANCVKIAHGLGLDLGAFSACVASPETDARIKADSEAFKATHGHGLPTLWVDEERLEGAQDAPTFKRALERAIARERS